MKDYVLKLCVSRQSSKDEMATIIVGQWWKIMMVIVCVCTYLRVVTCPIAI